MSPLRWTTKSTRSLAAELTAQGHRVSADTVGDLLLESLFTFDSASLRSGIREIRAWISLAAAMDRPGEVMDYMPIHACYAGISFVKWSVES